MSYELIGIMVLGVMGLIQMAGLTALGTMLYRMWEQTSAVQAATFLQGRRMEDILKEVRQELARTP